MFDAKKILDQLLGSQFPGGQASGQSSSSRGFPGAASSGIPGLSGGMGGMLGQVTDLVKQNPKIAATIAAAVLGSKSGRKLAGNVTSLGGLAAIAGLGYLAYKNYKSGLSPQSARNASLAEEPLELPPADSPFSLHSADHSHDFALALIRATIAAARADGHIDTTERAMIMQKLQASEIGSEAEEFIRHELSNPVDIDDLVGCARTEEQKVELYTATRMAIEPDTRAERGYLDLLAGRLGLPDELIEHIDATVSSAKVYA